MKKFIALALLMLAVALAMTTARMQSSQGAYISEQISLISPATEVAVALNAGIPACAVSFPTITGQTVSGQLPAPAFDLVSLTTSVRLTSSDSAALIPAYQLLTTDTGVIQLASYKETQGANFIYSTPEGALAFTGARPIVAATGDQKVTPSPASLTPKQAKSGKQQATIPRAAFSGTMC